MVRPQSHEADLFVLILSTAYGRLVDAKSLSPLRVVNRMIAPWGPARRSASFVGDDSGCQGDGEANDGLEGALSQEGADRGWQHEIAEQKGPSG